MVGGDKDSIFIMSQAEVKVKITDIMTLGTFGAVTMTLRDALNDENTVRSA